MPSQPGAIQVTDRLERRIRKPIDLLRCVSSGIEIIVLAIAGVAASATTSGIETNIVGASRRLHTLLTVAQPLVLFGILIVPVALAVRQLVRRQVQRLAEAVATGILAAAVAAVLNAALQREVAARLYDAIIMSHPGASHAAALDPYLAGVVAYATIIGLSGRPGWRNALWLAVGVYALVHLVDLDTTVLSFLITLLVGRTIGLGVRYVAGSPSLRPSAAEIAAALNSTDRQVTEISRLRTDPKGPMTPNRAGSRHYAAMTSTSSRLDITVYDRDQQAAGRLLPAVPVAPAARAGVTRRAPVGGPDRGTPGADVLRGRRRGCAHPGCARWSGPGPKPPYSPTTTTTGRRWPSATGAPTPSCGTSGTPYASCTSTGSRTGR